MKHDLLKRGCAIFVAPDETRRRDGDGQTVKRASSSRNRSMRESKRGRRA